MCHFEMFLTPVENFLSFVKTKVELKFAHRKPHLAQATFSPFRKMPTRLKVHFRKKSTFSPCLTYVCS